MLDATTDALRCLALPTDVTTDALRCLRVLRSCELGVAGVLREDGLGGSGLGVLRDDSRGANARGVRRDDGSG